MSRAAQRFPWLTAWKASSARRSVEAYIAGANLYQEDKPEWFIAPAWRHAGFPDEPLIELVLRRDRTAVGRVLISETSGKSLVLSANGLGRDDSVRPVVHWFDRENISFHPRAPKYLLVEPNGARELRIIPTDARELAPVLAEMQDVMAR